jgi:transposase
VRKDPVRKSKKIIFHQDNTPAHKSVLAMGKLMDLHHELLEYPPFSPDLAPSDFCLIPKLKLFLAGQRFFFESRGDRSCRGVFCRSYEEPLQGRENGAGASLE